MNQNWKRELLTWICIGFYRMLSCTWRYENWGRPPIAGSFVYGHWHRDELLLFRAFSFSRMLLLISQSADGGMLARLLGGLGYRFARGSSSRNAVAGLKALIDTACATQWNCSLACDGPRGPVFQVKAGIVKLAQHTGYPLVLIGCAARPRWFFKKAWNRSYLPLPFAKCRLVFSQPIHVPRRLSKEEVEQWRQRIEVQLLILKEEAENSFLPAHQLKVSGCSAGG